MSRLSNYTLAGIEAQLYPGRAEFRRGKDKKKRKSRSMTDNLLGTTTAGRIARGVGAAALLGGGGMLGVRALNRMKSKSVAGVKGLPAAGGSSSRNNRSYGSQGAGNSKGVVREGYNRQVIDVPGYTVGGLPAGSTRKALPATSSATPQQRNSRVETYPGSEQWRGRGLQVPTGYSSQLASARRKINKFLDKNPKYKQ